jgi:uncharacterized phage-associated protein
MDLIGRHPLAVANQVLDLAAAQRLPVSNLALQKLLYFSHGWLLAADARPLVRGGFQAWEHGPVSRTVYAVFKASVDRPIATRAVVVDFGTDEERVATANFDDVEIKLMRDVLGAYGHLHPFELSRLTHEPGSPWHRIWTSETVIPGMKIPDHLIREHFMDHRFVIKN